MDFASTLRGDDRIVPSISEMLVGQKPGVYPFERADDDTKIVCSNNGCNKPSRRVVIHWNGSKVLHAFTYCQEHNPENASA